MKAITAEAQSCTFIPHEPGRARVVLMEIDGNKPKSMRPSQLHVFSSPRHKLLLFYRRNSPYHDLSRSPVVFVACPLTLCVAGWSSRGRRRPDEAHKRQRRRLLQGAEGRERPRGDPHRFRALREQLHARCRPRRTDAQVGGARVLVAVSVSVAGAGAAIWCPCCSATQYKSNSNDQDTIFILRSKNYTIGFPTNVGELRFSRLCSRTSSLRSSETSSST